jgi:hypothetical protein
VKQTDDGATEFDVTLAQPQSPLIPVTRIEGIGWTPLGAGNDPAARSSPARAAWCGWTAARPDRSRVLFVKLARAAASVWPLARAVDDLDQLIDECATHGPRERRAVDPGRACDAGRASAAGG